VKTDFINNTNNTITVVANIVAAAPDTQLSTKQNKTTSHHRAMSSPVADTNDTNDFVDERVTLGHASGASVTTHLHGATILSWTTSTEKQNKERLLVSDDAVFRGDKAVRGGVPVVFPQFGPGALKQHGFARVSRWHRAGGVRALPNGDQSVTFTLHDNAETRAQWPHAFLLELVVTLGAASLITELRVTNKNETGAFDFTALLHTCTYCNAMSRYFVLRLIRSATSCDAIQSCVRSCFVVVALRSATLFD
jgi:D-hexose-6-phosphate mutarotase